MKQSEKMLAGLAEYSKAISKLSEYYPEKANDLRLAVSSGKLTTTEATSLAWKYLG